MSASCPVCHAPLPSGLRRCDECLVPIEWTAGPAGTPPRPIAKHPFIRPGEILYFSDATKGGVLPGKDELSGTLSDGVHFEGTPHGALITLKPKRAFEAFEHRLRCRDACVRASLTALDREVTLAVIGRISRLDTAALAYVLEVDPLNRTFGLKRGFSSATVSEYAALVPATVSPLVAPIGQANTIELRMQGATLEARINDQHATTVHDAVLGIGAGGLRVSSRPGSTTAGRACASWFELRGVTA